MNYHGDCFARMRVDARCKDVWVDRARDAVAVWLCQRMRLLQGAIRTGEGSNFTAPIAADIAKPWTR